MVHLYNKVGFISFVMEALGYAPKQVMRAEGSDGLVYWLDGLTGFYNPVTQKYMSFVKAQTLARALLWAIQNSGIVQATPETTYNFWKHDLILTYSDIARIVSHALWHTSPGILVGGFGGVVYCNRKKLVKDEANGVVLSLSRNTK